MIPNAFKLDYVYQQRIGFQSTGAATEDVLDRVVRPGQVLILTYMGLRNLDHAMTSLVMGWKDGDVWHDRYEQAAPAADTLYWMEHLVIVREGQRPGARVAGATSGDHLILELEGFYGRIEEERI